MRVWLISDLHLEDPRSRTQWARVNPPGFDILACAGDLFEADPARCADIVAELAAGRPAVMVLGNRDTWGIAVEEAVEAARAARPEIKVLDASACTILGVTFAGGTLWPGADAGDASGRFGEPIFVAGPTMDRRAKPRDLQGMHDRTMMAIETAEPDVILTHYPARASDLARLRKPSTWLHGHVHDELAVDVDAHRVIRAPFGTGGVPGCAGVVIDVFPEPKSDDTASGPRP